MKGNCTSRSVTMENVRKAGWTTGSGIINSTDHLKYKSGRELSREATQHTSTKIVNELGLTGQKELIRVKVPNDQNLHFMSGTFEIGLESTDGRVDMGRLPTKSVVV